MNTKDTITNLLLGTKRDGMIALVDWLVTEGFFEAPASTRFHGSHPGGLADHSLRLYKLLETTALYGPLTINSTSPCDGLKLDAGTPSGKKPLPIEKDTCIIAGLLHDVCKVRAYIPTPDGKNPYKWNKEQPEGHATLSIERIKKFIELAPLEELMIRYHMGFYGMYEYYEKGTWEYKTQPEFHLRSQAKKPKNPTPDEKKADQADRYSKSWRNATYHNPIVKVMYFCDELATLEEKARAIQEINEPPL